MTCKAISPFRRRRAAPARLRQRLTGYARYRERLTPLTPPSYSSPSHSSVRSAPVSTLTVTAAARTCRRTLHLPGRVGGPPANARVHAVRSAARTISPNDPPAAARRQDMRSGCDGHVQIAFARRASARAWARKACACGARRASARAPAASQRARKTSPLGLEER